ncbi:hypothetical protein LP419_40465 [Massilia sp. H-1]|nr:hypothetical protein LP419_40465 [Massilia sp. H-1]
MFNVFDRKDPVQMRAGSGVPLRAHHLADHGAQVLMGAVHTFGMAAVLLGMAAASVAQESDPHLWLEEVQSPRAGMGRRAQRGIDAGADRPGPVPRAASGDQARA